jgi:hypothetical protein
MTDKTNEAFMAGIESVKDRTLPEGVTVEQIRTLLTTVHPLVSLSLGSYETANAIKYLLKQLEPRKDSQ